MTINQISIFLENKFGKLNEILSILSKENIRIIAATVADTSDYGILRIITSDQQKAYNLLKEKQVSANLSEVIAIEIDPSIGKFAETIELFTQAGIEIEYMYCFSVNHKAMLVLRTKNLETAFEVIRKNNMIIFNS
ncbi:MAG: acetolactate synthase [Dysgonamonadaceae bacterium]|jgi:hypothetical protein|nr:acetolactate synthase [Dysgonamonadaceae bacterium]